MTKSFIDMMKLLSLGARGEKIENKADLDIPAIKKLARSQGIWPTVYSALSEITPEVFQMAALKTIRQTAVYKLVKELKEEKNITCCFLKGEILDDMYHDPGIRMTADSDLLIDPKHEREVIKLLKSKGYLIHERQKTSNELQTVHPKIGLVEFHTDLDNKQMREVWFNNKFREPEKFRIHTSKSDIEYLTLSETDGLIFVTLHFIKHLISGVASVKMMMDVLMYIETYKETVNWGKFDGLMAELKYEKLIMVLKFIGTKYLGFRFQTEALDDLATKLLDDLEFNRQTKENLEFYDKYTESRYKIFGNGDYKGYKLKLTLISFKKIFFPSRVTMCVKYPYLIKKPALLPYAWCERAVKSVSKRKSRSTEPKNPNNKDSHIELIKDLDMM